MNTMSNRSITITCLTMMTVVTVVYHHADAQTWTRFRGPNGSGVSNATTVPTRWTAKDYNWQTELPGVGHSSPVVWEKKIFLTSGDDEAGQRFVLCVDTTDGKLLWKRAFETKVKPRHRLSSLASSTPVVDGRHVYVCWEQGQQLVALALDHDGKEVWRADLGVCKTGYRYSASPILHDNLLIVPKEHSGDSQLLALDCGSGKQRWKVDRDSKGTWSTPCIHQRQDGNDELIFTTWTRGITAVDPKTGKINWEVDVFDKGHTESTIGSPIVAGDFVLGGSGWLGVRKEIVAVRAFGRGEKTKAERVYTLDRGAPLCTTPLVVDDLLLMWADEGIVTCADVRTGKVHWKKRIGGKYYSSPICVANRVYNVSTDGQVVVLAASKDFRELARNDVGRPTHATPAVADGVMYLRTFSRLYSLGGKK